MHYFVDIRPGGRHESECARFSALPDEEQFEESRQHYQRSMAQCQHERDTNRNYVAALAHLRRAMYVAEKAPVVSQGCADAEAVLRRRIDRSFRAPPTATQEADAAARVVLEAAMPSLAAWLDAPPPPQPNHAPTAAFTPTADFAHLFSAIPEPLLAEAWRGSGQTGDLPPHAHSSPLQPSEREAMLRSYLKMEHLKCAHEITTSFLNVVDLKALLRDEAGPDTMACMDDAPANPQSLADELRRALQQHPGLTKATPSGAKTTGGHAVDRERTAITTTKDVGTVTERIGADPSPGIVPQGPTCTDTTATSAPQQQPSAAKLSFLSKFNFAGRQAETVPKQETPQYNPGLVPFGLAVPPRSDVAAGPNPTAHTFVFAPPPPIQHAHAQSTAPNGHTAANAATEPATSSGFISAGEQLAKDVKTGKVNPALLSNAPRPNIGLRKGFTPPFAAPPPPPQGPQVNIDKVLSATVKGSNPNAAKQQDKKADGDADGDFPACLLLPDGSVPPQLEGLEPKLVAQVANEILERRDGPGVGWEDIAGLSHAKKSIEEAIVWPLMRPDLFVGLRDPPRGLLLFGPPGTGKTMIARAIASRASCTFMNISASSLMSKWVGEGEKLVRCMFAVAAVKQPTVIFIDEIDSLLTMRSEGEMDAVRRVKTEFFVQMDGVGTDSRDRILLIGATNRPEELDEAARRRMEKRLYIPLPDAPSRMELLRRLITPFAHSLAEDHFSLLGADTAGYSGADIKILSREAAMGPLRSSAKELMNRPQETNPANAPIADSRGGTNRDISAINSDTIRPVSLRDYKVALRRIKPSVGTSEIERYETWNTQFGSFAQTSTDPNEDDEYDDDE